VTAAWYRFRTTFGHRWGGYLAIVVLTSLVGGLAMGSIAAARRTASSFTVFWASTNPSELGGADGVLNPALGADSAYDPELLARLAHLPHVTRVESQSGIDFLPLQADGAPLDAPKWDPPAAGNGYGSVDGLYFNQDKVALTAGRMADPGDPDQLMLSAQGASALGVQVGSVLPVGIYTNAQTELPDFGTAAVKPYRVVREKVVGLIAFANSIVVDDVDMSQAANNLFTPALTRQLLDCCVNYTASGVQVEGGTRNVGMVEREIAAALPAGFPPFVDNEPQVVAKAQRAVKPEAIALGAFGAIVALAAVLIAGQLIGRQLRLGAEERAVLRALGAGPVQASSDGLIGIVASVVLGSVLAMTVAVGLSPLAPLGPVRAVFPFRGVSFDWTVLGLGAAVLVVVLSAVAALLALVTAPHRANRRQRSAGDRPSTVVRAAAAMGMPAPALTGVRFALESGTGAEAVPVRSAMLGACLAVVAVVATVVFGSSLDSLVAHPALYGWNWDYALVSGGGDIPQQQVATLLDRDRSVAQWSPMYTADLSIAGQEVPVLGESVTQDKVQPPVLSGHGLRADDQVVLGAVTLAQLHTHVGAWVEESDGTSAPMRLRVVGTAAMPTLGGNGGQHLEMGTGALLSYGLIPAIDRNPFNDPLPGPLVVAVRLRPTADHAAAVRALDAIAADTTNTADFGVEVTKVLRPAEIVNYRSLGSTPAFLGAGLALGSVTALALTLVASVRRRRRDLALLKTLGFTKGQLAATVAWQSTIAVAIGTAVGVPLGIVLGRWLWDLFARSIHAVPVPDVPVLTVVAIAGGALVLANVVAAVPGRLAARTQTAMLLRTD